MGGGSARGLKSDYYIFGLGNPGAKYHNTRHNAGFDALDILAQKHDVSFSKSAYSGLCAKIETDTNRILLIKPQTFMNHSGRCVAAFMKKFSIAPSRIIVVYDDIDLKKGALRIRSGGSAGTHNGLKSIIAETQHADFIRVRIGIGKPLDPDRLIPFVLGKHPKKDWEIMFRAYEAAGDAVITIVSSGVASAQAAYNKKGSKP